MLLMRLVIVGCSCVFSSRRRHTRGALVTGVRRVLFRSHGAVEVEELRVLAVGLVEDLRADSFALAPQDVGLALRLGFDHRSLAVGGRLDALRLLEALGTELRSLALALRAHAVVDRLPGRSDEQTSELQ